MRLLILLVLFFTSCGFLPPVGQNYKKPQSKLPKEWVNEKTNQFEEIEIKWWENFEDPVLNKLIEVALKNNYDFKIMQSRVIEARANVSAKTADMLPKVNAKATGSRMNNFFNFINPNRHPIVNFYTAGFDASWELDLFGGNYRARQAAKALWEASDEAKNYNKISLIAEVVKNYARLRQAQNQLFLQKEISRSFDEMLELVQKQNRVGLLSDVDLGQIQTDTLTSKEGLAQAQADAATSLYNLELLLGKKPSEMKYLFGEYGEVPILRKKVLLAAPAALLRNRPDIRQAERELAASVELKGYALAQVFPKISLTGFFGFVSGKSGNLLTAQNRTFAGGGGVTMPLVNFGGLKAGIDIAREHNNQALLAYESKINQALFDVESSLINFVKEDEKLTLNLQSYEIYKTNSNLDFKRSKSGLISHLQYLKTHVQFLQAEQKLNQEKADFAQKTISLYKALGGGW